MNTSPKRSGLFQSATVRLMLSYTAILMTLSLLFSAVLFAVATGEVNRALGPRRPGEALIFADNDTFTTARQLRIQEGEGRLIASLVLFNLVVLAGGSALSYLLAKRTLEPIKQAHEAQARFTSDAAHELRTPLAVMQTEIEVSLRDKKAGKKQYKDTLKSGLEEVSRLRLLTDRLLRLASQDSLPFEVVSLERAVAESVGHNLAQAKQRKIVINNQVGQDKAYGHFESVVNVVDILLDNAVKYSPPNTTVTIQTVTKDKRVEILVEDEGAGIPVDEREKIFERFYRMDTSRSKVNVEGHGLGLSLARRLAGEMKGTLEVEGGSEKGTVFSLSLLKADIK